MKKHFNEKTFSYNLFKIYFIKNKYPACDGRCVQNLSTSSPKRADLLITRDSNFM